MERQRYKPPLVDDEQVGNDVDIVDLLNELIEICRDGRNGYQTAADNATDDDHKQLFQEYAEQRAQFISELANLVIAHDGEPEEGDELKATFHRAWINIKTAVTDSDTAVLEECIRGEEKALEEYNDAMDEYPDLPTGITTTLQSQRAKIRAALENLKSMKRVD